MELRDRQVLQDLLVQLAPQGHKALRDLLVRQVQLDQQVRQAQAQTRFQSHYS